jgi:hypothetical protein
MSDRVQTISFRTRRQKHDERRSLRRLCRSLSSTRLSWTLSRRRILDRLARRLRRHAALHVFWLWAQ